MRCRVRTRNSSSGERNPALSASISVDRSVDLHGFDSTKQAYSAQRPTRTGRDAARPAVAVRRRLAPSFRHHPLIVWATALAVFLILIAWGPTAGNRGLLGIALLAATTAIAIEALRRQTLREFPERPRPARKRSSLDENRMSLRMPGCTLPT
jgi:hypothetical protein